MCEKVLQKPLTLDTCLHSYCETCMDTLDRVDQGSVHSVVCGVCHALCPDDEVQENSFIRGLNAVMSAEPTQPLNCCQQCLKESSAGMLFCVDCKMVLCGDCGVAHVRIPFLANHKITGVEEMDTGVLDVHVYCHDHPTCIVQYNCKTCELQVCSACVVSRHHSHDIETCEKAFYRLKQATLSYVQNIQSNITTLEKQVKEIDGKVEEAKEMYSSVQTGITARMKDLEIRLTDQKDELEKSLAQQEAVALAKLQSVEDELKRELSKIKSISDTTKVTLENCSHQTLLHHIQSGLMAAVSDVSKQVPGPKQFQVNTPVVCLDEWPKEEEDCVKVMQEVIGKVKYCKRELKLSGIQTKIGACD